MKNFTDAIIFHLGPEAIRELAAVIDVDDSVIKELIMPMAQLVFSGLKRQKYEHGGMDRVDQILNKHGSERILNDPAAFFSQKQADQRLDSSLGGLLGVGGGQAAEIMSHRFELTRVACSRIIPVLGPVVLGFLSYQRRQSGIGLCGISAIVDQQGDSQLLDDIPRSFLSDPKRSDENSEVLAGLLKGLTSAGA